MTRSGYVLVGGQSSRMGRDKALLPLHGMPLARSIALQVAEAAGSAALIGSPAAYGALGFPVIADDFPGEGPLGAILTALRRSTAECNLIVACDMPELSAGFLHRLFAAAESLATTVVPRGPGGRLEPLCAVWRRDALPGVESAFAQGIRKVAAALETIAVTVYPVAEIAPFQNVNTPEEWTRHARE